MDLWELRKKVKVRMTCIAWVTVDENVRGDMKIENVEDIEDIDEFEVIQKN